MTNINFHNSTGYIKLLYNIRELHSLRIRCTLICTLIKIHEEKSQELLYLDYIDLMYKVLNHIVATLITFASLKC